MTNLKLIVEQHADSFVAYPVGISGTVIGQGDTYEEALADVKSALNFHLESFGPNALDVDEPVLDAFVTETTI
jgi:predicted RNase H-like HicB family nuclease